MLGSLRHFPVPLDVTGNPKKRLGQDGLRHRAAWRRKHPVTQLPRASEHHINELHATTGGHVRRTGAGRQGPPAGDGW
jgi:hypothetical protein